jgi:cytochrome c oxidase assembly factor CtaG
MSLWHWHPSVVLGLGGLVALYLIGVGPLRRRFAWGPAVPSSQMITFFGGVGAMAVALLGPIAEWAEHVALSAHMVQHLLLTLVVPPLWLAGTPGWLLRPLLRVPAAARVGWALTRPAVALPIASITLIVWHMPALFGAALEREDLHILEHLTLLGTALLAWWPIAGPLPDWPRPAPPAQLLYLFLCVVPMTAAAAPITLADRVLYPFYEAGRVPWPLAPAADQELAGTLMWMGGMLAYLIAGTIVFFRWAVREGREEPEPSPTALPGNPR